MNSKVLAAEYAVRGRLVLEAEALAKKLKQPDHGLPFKEIIFCNIGNPQAVGQKPLTFPRQLISLCLNPSLLEPANLPVTKKLFHEDAIARAQQATKTTAFGAYSHSMGLEWIRQDVAAFIQNRDQGVSSVADNIFLTDGASDGISRIMEMLIRSETDGILIPIPQYPLYSATLSLVGGRKIPYYLDEQREWGFTVQNLEKAVAQAAQYGIEARAMVIINPGNPTGQVLTEENMKDVIRFCHKQRLVILADEVYQSNVYNPAKPFLSFKKVLSSMPECWDTELVSFHSTSKGFLGECGFRGGYMETVNIHPFVKEQLYKFVSIGLCSNLPGQLMTDVLVKPPAPGEASYDLYIKERDAVLSSLSRRAKKVTRFLNELEGVSCNDAEGAMYVFPQITLPKAAVLEAKKLGLEPDVFYCLQLLVHTGICVVPGSGFGQENGTFHFRSTFLPAEEKIESMGNLMRKFHTQFLETYGGLEKPQQRKSSRITIAARG